MTEIPVSSVSQRSRHAVTGAFGYSGQHIARRLLATGERVITLTNSHPPTASFAGQVEAFPLNFADPPALKRSLAGVAVLYNTYWVRFNHHGFNHNDAVANTRVLIRAASEAGVRRVVHISITNPSPHSTLEYFRGKALLEETVRGSGLAYAILRPAVLFGEGDILINNIAWALRRFPLFMLFGDGCYRLSPIHVTDLAELAVTQGQADTNVTLDAIGPESFTYADLVQTIGEAIGHTRPTLNVPPGVGYLAAKLISWAQRDVFLTREEITGLMNDLLYVESPPTGATKLTCWLKEHADKVGRRYASELARRRLLKA